MNEIAADPPAQCKAAEGQVLGAMLLGGHVVPDVQALISAKDFFTLAHGTIYSVLCDMHAGGKAIDLAGAFVEFQRRDLLRTIGQGTTDADGRDYLVALAEGVPAGADGVRAAGNALYYARQVREIAQLRQLEQLGGELQSLAKGGDLGNVLAYARQRLDELTDEAAERGLVSAAGALADVVADTKSGRPREVVATGFPSIDGPLGGGFEAGNLIALAADTAGGKSAFSLNIAAHVAAVGQPVLYASAEMTIPEIRRRLAAMLARVSVNRIKARNLNEHESAALDAAAAQVRGWPLYLTDAAQSVPEISSWTRQVGGKTGRRVAMVVADYLQLLRAETGDSLRERIAGLAWALKELAMRTPCAVLMLSQLSRADLAGGRLPSLHGLKEASDIGQHSNVVLLLHQTGEYDTNGMPIVWGKVAKARDGRTTPWPKAGARVSGAIRLRFIPEQLRFEDTIRESDDMTMQTPSCGGMPK
uniref:DNA 5'-3' helicase n=1 Tax=viral metagenome TaxID=1070528 RepID=A0A6M3L7S1_9ZZZZ